MEVIIECVKHLSPLPPSDAVWKQKKIEDLFSSVLSQFKKYHPSRNLKLNSLGIPHGLKLRNLMGKILRISLKLNFTPNAFGCYGSIQRNASPSSKYVPVLPAYFFLWDKTCLAKVVLLQVHPIAES